MQVMLQWVMSWTPLPYAAPVPSAGILFTVRPLNPGLYFSPPLADPTWQADSFLERDLAQ